MTFPIVKEHPKEAKYRIMNIVQRAISSHTSFYGYMLFSSAHRAIMCGDLPDFVVSGNGIERQFSSREFLWVKARCINILNEVMKDHDQATSDNALEAVMLLCITCVSITVEGFGF